MNTKTVQLILVEPHDVVSEGLKRILGRSRFRLVYQCKMIAELWEHAPAGREIGAILIDISENSSITAADMANLRRTYPLAKIVLMSDPPHCQSVMQVGREADGLIFRTYGAEIIVKALELIALGERIFPVDAWQPFAADARRPAADANPCVEESRLQQIPPPPEILPETFEKLSDREVEVVRYLCNGDPNKIIARQLGISEATVKVHVKAILRKTQAKNRTEAALLMSAITRSTASH